jgi:hypothetical protein
MKLKREQCEKLRIWVTEACDKCGQLLGSIRWTRLGECGEWCSKSCRDRIAAGAPKSNSKGCLECGIRLDGKRSDSRFFSDTHKKRHQRREPSRTARKPENSRDTPIGKQRLTDTRCGLAETLPSSPRQISSLSASSSGMSETSRKDHQYH